VLLFGRTESGQEMDMNKKTEDSVRETKQESSLSLLFKQLQDPHYGCRPFPGIDEERTGPEIFVNVPCDETGARWDYSYKVTRVVICNTPYYQNYSWVALASYNQNKSAARFCHQVAAWVPDMFCNFYLVKSHKIANNSATT
jgi:hypothetical protein